MAKRRNNSEAADATAVTAGYDSQLWQMTDALRDTLLPKLVSGELRVRDDAHIVLEANV